MIGGEKAGDEDLPPSVGGNARVGHWPGHFFRMARKKRPPMTSKGTRIASFEQEVGGEAMCPRPDEQKIKGWAEIMEAFEKRLSKYSQKAHKPDIQEGFPIYKLGRWILVWLAFLSIALLALWFFGKAPFANIYQLLGLFLFFICPLLGLALRLLGKLRK